MRAGWMSMLVVVGCGRSPLGTEASASGAGSASGSDESDSADGAIPPPDDDDDDDPPPPDDPGHFDLGAELPPPVACADAPRIPVGPSCFDQPTEAVELFDGDGSQAIVTVDNDWVYAVVHRRGAAEAWRIDKCSGHADLLAPAGLNPANIIVVDDHLIWTDYSDVGSLWQVPLDGGEPIAIATAHNPLSIVLADEWIVYSSFQGTFRIPRAGGAVEALFAAGEHFLVDLSYDGTLVFGSNQAVGAVSWLDPIDGSYGELVTAPDVGDVVADCELVFWSDEYGELQRTDRDSGATDAVGIATYRFTQDPTHVFTSTGGTQVLAIDKHTLESRVVGDIPGELPWRIAVDATQVYWTSAMSGRVWAAPNPFLR